MLNIAALTDAGIDTEEGMAYCADDPEFYEEMLMEFVSEAMSHPEEMDRLLSDADWVNYGIHAHTLKSTSRMIGAIAFSERARAMEMAAKAGDGDMIFSNHASFAAEYAALVDTIRKAAEQERGINHA